jgi:hemerythrin-like domain-containing protein
MTNNDGDIPSFQACSKHTPPIQVPASTMPVRLNFVWAKKLSGDRMLTSTYTLVVLSVEQTTVRSALQSVARGLHALPDEDATLAPGQAAQLCAELRQVVDDCHARKLDKYLVPALRRDTCAADGLLRDLEQISNAASDSLAAAEACVDAGVRGVDGASFREAVERCIAALRCRLEREEHELFPMARSLVRGEAWFAIANQMLAHDALARERSGARRGRARPDAVQARRPLYEPRGGHEGAGQEFGRRHATLPLLH